MSVDAPEIPPEVRALMAELGPHWGADTGGNIARMLEAFTAVHAGDDRRGFELRADICYGSHPRQQLDVYLPDQPGAGRAAVVFVHGGAFTEGHRNRTPEIYANVLRYFARNGVVGINVGYRLADAAVYPGASLDVGEAVRWTRRNAAELGIDAERVFLLGHSAGAGHAGSYAYDRRLQPAEGPGLRGLLVVSGRVRAEMRPENPNAPRVAAYYGLDPQAQADASAVSLVRADSVPTFIAYAEYENPLIDVHCLELAFRLADARGKAPPVLWLEGHNHTSSIAHIGTAEDRLGRAMLGFIARPI